MTNTQKTNQQQEHHEIVREFLEEKSNLGLLSGHENDDRRNLTHFAESIGVELASFSLKVPFLRHWIEKELSEASEESIIQTVRSHLENNDLMETKHKLLLPILTMVVFNLILGMGIMPIAIGYAIVEAEAILYVKSIITGFEKSLM